MSTSRKRRLTGVLAVVLAAGTGVAVTSGTSSAHPRDKTLDLQILSFNDFHGNLEPPAGSSGRLVVDHYLDTTVTPNRVLDVTSTGRPVAGLMRWSRTRRPLEPAGGSRFPWKSLNDRIWMSIVGPLAASEVPLVAATPARAQAPTATPPRRRVRRRRGDANDMVLPGCAGWRCAARGQRIPRDGAG